MDIMGFSDLVINPKEDFLSEEDHLDKLFYTMTSVFSDLQNFLKIFAKNKGSSTCYKGYQSFEQKGTAQDYVCESNERYLWEDYWKFYEEILDSLYFFSDTVFYSIEASTKEVDQITQFAAICDITNKMIKHPMLIPKGTKKYQMLMRGALSYGPARIDNDKHVYLGKPIIDAYNLSEAQLWMGAAIHPSIHEMMATNAGLVKKLIGFDAPLYRYNVPLKKENSESFGNKRIRYALNWYQDHKSIEKFETSIKDHLIPRPLMKDIIESHYIKYNWKTNFPEQNNKLMDYDKNTRNFAKEIDAEFDECERKLKKEKN
jgi:hypothetical protein